MVADAKMLMALSRAGCCKSSVGQPICTREVSGEAREREWQGRQ